MSISATKGACGFSVILPAHNEAMVIEAVVRDFYEKVIKKIPAAKLFIVEDGSTDGTKQILSRLNQGIPFVLIGRGPRRGYTDAFKEALGVDGSELVLFCDADGQHEPQDVFKMLEELKENDIVSGYKFPRRDPLHRVIISKLYNLLIYVLFGLKLKDINSGFKLIRRRVIDGVLKDVTDFRHCVMSEFVLKAYLGGYKIKEIPVRHYPRKSGHSVIFRVSRLPLIIAAMLGDILKLKISCLKRECRCE